MAREARVEGGVAVRFWGPVFEDAGGGGGEEVGFVDVSFGAEGEDFGGGVGVCEGVGEGDRCCCSGRGGWFLHWYMV